MNPQPLVVFDLHNAILHIDADAFFAACEQATNPQLAGKPVIVGRERGIVTAASYEAKARGIKRGMRIWEVRNLCPDAIILNSDYEKYSLFSVRMMEILKRFWTLPACAWYITLPMRNWACGFNRQSPRNWAFRSQRVSV